MNQIVIIGNGFDLAHGLETKYAQFMLSLLKGLIIKGYENFGKQISVGPFMIHCRRKFSNHDTMKILSTLPTIESIIDYPHIYVSSNNTSGILFSPEPHQDPYDNKPIIIQTDSSFIVNLIHQYKDGKWIDIETEYFVQLNQILEENSSDQDVKDEITALNEDLEYLKSELVTYLAEIERTFDYDEFTKAQSEFAKRIQRFITPPKSHSIGLHGVKRLIINYNYTSTVESNLVGFRTDIETSISHIHGSLDHSESDIVFGFGSVDGPELRKILSCGISEAARNLKFLIYHRSGQNKELNRILKDGPFEVRIVGHSCGLSDGSTLREVFEHENCLKISVCYLDSDEFSEKTYNIYCQLKEFKKLPIEAMDKDLCFKSELSESANIEVS